MNNFSPMQVRHIFRTYDRLLEPGGTLTYYEYILVLQLQTPFVGRRARRRLRCLNRLVNGYIHDYQYRRQSILANVPPAIVRHLRFKQVAPLRKGSADSRFARHV